MTPRPRGRRGQKRVWGFLDEADPYGLVVLMRAYLDVTRARQLSEASVRAREASIGSFILFCQERGITKAQDVTRPVLERYQRQLFLYRKADGLPLSAVFQHGQLTDLKLFFRWLVKSGYLLANPASELELPKLPKRLPEVLSQSEVERLLAQPDLGTSVGLRDRAILEVFYSTAMRRKELASLRLHDVDFERGQVTIRQGKGRKDRVVPIGERALAWLDRYLLDVRPRLATEPDHGTLFLTSWGEPIHHGPLGNLVKHYLEKAELHKRGCCHLLRHTAATLMHENGADVRFIQQLLGHASLETTQIYTHVSIRKLKEVHAVTHPGAKLWRPSTQEGAQEPLSSQDEAEPASTSDHALEPATDAGSTPRQAGGERNEP